MDKTILPKPKPKNYKKTLDMLNTKAAANTFSPKTYINLVGEFAKKAYDNNELSQKEYMNIVKPLFGDAGIMASEKIEDYRKKFDLGGSTDYRAMVTRMYILSGGQEKTGMDIESFAKQYFPRDEKAYGGRMALESGTMPKSERWMRDYFFSGKGGYDDRMSYKEFAMGPGQELYKKLGNK